jgi:hypothetical protein
LIGNFERFS